MRGSVALAACCAAIIVLNSGKAHAQDTVVFGGADTLPPSPGRTPITYITSYDRDVSTGTWTQSLSYSLTRPRVNFSTSGGYSTVDQIGRPEQGAGSGTISGRLDFRALKNWTLSADGQFNKAASRDIASQTAQRQNRLKVTSQYTVSPLRGLAVRALLSTEMQEDHSLAVRPSGQGLARLFTIRDANGDSVGVDTFYVQRDSTRTSGRQDGVSGEITWKPRPWFQMVTAASGNRIRPSTTSYLGGTETIGGPFSHRVESIRGSVPNDNLQYQTKLTYNGSHGLLSWLSLNRVRSDQEYYDRTALRQELFSVDQRGGALHVERSPFKGGFLSMDGSMNRFFGQYRVRSNRNSLVSAKAARASFSFNPSVASRAGLEFSVDQHDNSRQQSGNGTNVSRFLQANAGHRLSRRLSLDAVATASLISFQYADSDSVSDQDNTRGYVNVGGGYVISDRCSTLVHYSISRGHSVAIDASRSSANNVQTTYQLDSALRLGVTPRLRINQLYLLNAIYQIFDIPSAESKNVLSRIRRIDTTVSDSLFRFATMQLVHNFLSRDFGSFTRPAGESQRVYRIATKTYVQTVSATLNILPVPGVVAFVTQSLSNARINSAGGGRVVNNRWNLATGATINRTILGNGSLSGTVQHISAYDERNLSNDPLNEQDDWIAGVTLVKDF